MFLIIAFLDWCVALVDWLGRTRGSSTRDQPAQGATESMGSWYRGLAEARMPGAVGCLAILAFPGLFAVGFSLTYVLTMAMRLVAPAVADDPDSVAVVTILVAWLGPVLVGSVWVLRNARRPGRVAPSVVLTVMIAVDALLIAAMLVLVSLYG